MEQGKIKGHMLRRTGHGTCLSARCMLRAEKLPVYTIAGKAR